MKCCQFLFACLLAAVLASPIFSQKPMNPPPVACNFAGSMQPGAFFGQSNDTAFGADSILFLCFGDSIFFNHDGNFDLSGDPNPLTLPAVNYAFYHCQPTAAGATMAEIVVDFCLEKQIQSLPVVPWLLPVSSQMEAEGDRFFINSGLILDDLGKKKPVSLFHVPITTDTWNAANPYESASGAWPFGPCVNANPAAAIQMVYLKPILVENIQKTVGDNNCIASFQPRGGFSEWDLLDSPYQISVSKQGEPDIIPLLATKPKNMHHGGLHPKYHFPEPGLYDFVIEDGKSCGHQFTLNMNGCVPNDHLELHLAGNSVLPGGQVCLPLTVKNFSKIESVQATLKWDTNLFEFDGVTTGLLSGMFISFDSLLLDNGFLSFSWFDAQFDGETRPDGSPILLLCLKATGNPGDTSRFELTNDFTTILAEDPNGFQVAIKTFNNRIVIGEPVGTTEKPAADATVSLFPNPSADEITVQLAPTDGPTDWQIHAPTGQILRLGQAAAGEIQATIHLDGLPAGPYFFSMKNRAQAGAIRFLKMN